MAAYPPALIVDGQGGNGRQRWPLLRKFRHRESDARRKLPVRLSSIRAGIGERFALEIPDLRAPSKLLRSSTSLFATTACIVRVVARNAGKSRQHFAVVRTPHPAWARKSGYSFSPSNSSGCTRRPGETLRVVAFGRIRRPAGFSACPNND